MSKMPDFIIGGERRSGSSTLYTMLSLHPDTAMYPLADMDYFIAPELFSRERVEICDDDLIWRKTHSPEAYADLFEGLDRESKKVGQKDADLLYWLPSHQRLYDFLPETKFIFVLRDPIKRAESQYWNEIAKGRETDSFEEAISQEEENIRSSDYEKLHLCYLHRGKYIESLEHFSKYFPRERFHIVILEKLKQHPSEELKKIANFLDIDPEGFESAYQIHSNHQVVYEINERYIGTPVEKIIQGYDRIVEGLIVRFLPNDKNIRDSYRNKFKKLGKVSKREKNRLDHKLIKRLKAYYEPSKKELEDFLGYQIDEWL